MFIHITYSSSFAIDYSGNIIFSRVANYLFLSIKMHKQIGTQGKPGEMARWLMQCLLSLSSSIFSFATLS